MPALLEATITLRNFSAGVQQVALCLRHMDSQTLLVACNFSSQAVAWRKPPALYGGACQCLIANYAAGETLRENLPLPPYGAVVCLIQDR